ncbi:hypothetical protein BDL97_18G003600 [Sphagnum fallax]|nr:hypothetical protein BDL97_18G003600 [Sphagnum fallax]KAH8932895.1 hypothetical protein BDL97_18G003600 [Sphagnum fallax]
MAAPFISVNRFYLIDPKDDVNKTFDVVFFHGLQITGRTAPQEGYKRTWSTKDNKILWPREWLPNDLKHIRAFSLAYDTEATKWFPEGNSEDVDEIGENPAVTLVTGIEAIGGRPFALVGHSFGGLVIKALVNAMKTRSTSQAASSNALNPVAVKRANKFLENLKGIVFYSVPHTGADAEALGRYFEFRGLSTMVNDLRPFSRKMAKMSVLTEDAFYKKGVIIFAFGEGQPTFSNKMVVESASAMQLAGHNFYKLEHCNHMQVCKPPDRTHASYSMLLPVLRLCSQGLDPPQAVARRPQGSNIIERVWEQP